ncbi:MAG: cytoplasmic protein [Chloroflexi bacterium]|nr:cytoplasmic protein [Chloroflexota bacterium]
MQPVSEMAKVLLENDRVRMVEVRIKAGETLPMHSHPSYIIYSFNPGRFQFTTQDGRTEIVEYDGGQTVWRDAETHEVENIGTTESRALVIEFK